MEFCSECGSLLPAEEGTTTCDDCGTLIEGEASSTTEKTKATDGSGRTTETFTQTTVEGLPTTKSGSVKKSDAMEWLDDLDRPSSAELRQAVIEKPNDFSGSTFPADISNVRVTGDPAFIETVAGLFSWMVDMEDYSRRVEIRTAFDSTFEVSYLIHAAIRFVYGSSERIRVLGVSVTASSVVPVDCPVILDGGSASYCVGDESGSR